ncbi:MAG: helix-turn-helix domain-containing protein [Candidatus Pristimantibacillus sp.]
MGRHLFCFQIILTNGDRLWPASIFPQDNEYATTYLNELHLVEERLELEGKITATVFTYDHQGNLMTNLHKILTKDEIYIIQGPIVSFNPRELSVNEVFGLSEAARLWGIEGGGATIRKALERGDFRSDEIRKSDGVLLVTYPGMQRRYNAVMKEQWDLIDSYYVHKGIIQGESSWMRNESEFSTDYKYMSLLARRPCKASDMEKHS